VTSVNADTIVRQRHYSPSVESVLYSLAWNEMLIGNCRSVVIFAIVFERDIGIGNVSVDS